MARDIYSDIVGLAGVGGAVSALSNVQVTVYNVNADGTRGSVATIYQGRTAGTTGPTSRSGATGTNPFTTGASGAIEFWADAGEYEVRLRDLNVAARIADQSLYWEATPAVDGGIPMAKLATIDSSKISSAAAPTTIQPDDTASAGSSLSVAKADHRHAINCAAPGQIQPDDVAAEGTSTSFARADHKHAITAAPAIRINGQNQEGTGNGFSRWDHNHELPDYGSIFPCIQLMDVADFLVTANRLYLVQCIVPARTVLNSVTYVNGSSIAGSVKSALFDINMNRLAQTTATVGISGINEDQDVAWSSAYTADPGAYFLGLMFSSNAQRVYGGIRMGFNSANMSDQSSFAIPQQASKTLQPRNAARFPAMVTGG